MEKRNFNEALKQRELRERAESARRSGENEMTLDDAARVKVLSPGMLVFKRFIRNKLAIIGSAILIFMFLFAFLGPFLYPYGQTQVFTAYKQLNINYANAEERVDYTVYPVADLGISSTTKNLFNSIVKEMEETGKDQTLVQDKATGLDVVVTKLGDNVYTMSVYEPAQVGTYALEDIGKYNTRFKKMVYSGEAKDAAFDAAVNQAVTGKLTEFEYEENTYLVQPGANDKEYIVVGLGESSMQYTADDMGEEFTKLVGQCVQDGTSSFQYESKLYSIVADNSASYTINGVSDTQVSFVASTFVFDAVVAGTPITEQFKLDALLAIYSDDSFTYEGTDYVIAENDGQLFVNAADGTPFASISSFVVRRYNGEDSLDVGFKNLTREAVEKIEEEGLTSTTFTYNLPQLDENGLVITDENGKPVMVESELTVVDKVTDYVVICEQYTNMINRFAAPSREHVFGTDGDGMDILARMMAGGRVSLLVGFVVVFLELFLGVIMGGLAGYFGGWVDNLIMRLVDIFYCIPSMPILIIIGAMLDSLRLEPYVRLMWLMAILGVLGWAGIARLVRGQILSLRDQDFMVATEATGLPVRRRIFRHLVPNVMPQLIVNATMGLGSVILTESTLSFLGLGVKHPMATWGTMINSVATSAQSMISYTYIWIPVGLLICLTVVAFNFVGDGLRDAFDPKMKR